MARTLKRNMESDQTMDAFDRWRENCLAILDHGLVISCPDVAEWTEWMEESFVNGTHCVATADIQGFHVSTEFLGINFNITGIGPPIWFETMVFRGSTDGTLGTEIKYGALRYSTVADALAGHAVIF